MKSSNCDATLRPMPPPKPSYLSTVRTGKTNSDAFRTYVKQRAEQVPARTPRSRKTTATSNENDDVYKTCTIDNGDSRFDVWDTAKQPHSPPQQHRTIAEIFCEKDANVSGKQCDNTSKEKERRSGAHTVNNSSDLSPKGSHVKIGHSSTDDTAKLERHAARPNQVSHELVDKNRVGVPDVNVSEPSKSSTKRARDTNRLLEFDPQSPSARSDGLPVSSDSLSPFTFSSSSDKSAISSKHCKPCGLMLYDDGNEENVPDASSCKDDVSMTDAAQEVQMRLAAKAPPTRSSRILPKRPKGLEARALFTFQGEADNELSLAAGQFFIVLNEDLQTHWTRAAAEKDGVWIKGLVPQGWYTLTQNMTRSKTLNLPNRDDRAKIYLEDRRNSEGQACGGNGKLKRDDATAMKKPISTPGRVSAASLLFDEAASSKFENVCDGDATVQLIDSNNADASDQHQTLDALIRSSTKKSIFNRLEAFATSGAQAYVLEENGQRDAASDSNEIFEIVSKDNGYSAWIQPQMCTHIDLHSPEIHTDERGAEYVAFTLEASFAFVEEGEWGMTCPWWNPHEHPIEPAAISCVRRRFNQFRWLANHLHQLYPSIMQSLLPFPSAHHTTIRTARFEAMFVEERRRQLLAWLRAVARHPILSRCEGLCFFLDNEEEGTTWFKQAAKVDVNLKEKCGSLPRGSLVFSWTQHPLFSFDFDEASLELEQASKFSAPYEKSMNATVTGVLDTYKELRQASRKQSKTARDLSCALLQLITGAEVSKTGAKSTKPSSVAPSSLHLPPMGQVGVRDDGGATNEDRAWCWREGCIECHRLTIALQNTAEAFQMVADQYEAHSIDEMYDLHERLWLISRPHSQQASLIEVQRGALSVYEAATRCDQAFPKDKAKPDKAGSLDPENIASRSEKVLHVTLSEIERTHTERVQEWSALSRDLLDQQIGQCEAILASLRHARSKIDQVIPTPGRQSTAKSTSVDSALEETLVAGIKTKHDTRERGPILPSPYEAQLQSPYKTAELVVPDIPLVAPSRATALATRPVDTIVDWISGNGTVAR